MAYFLSPALAQFRAEANALWPNRSKASDGWIGDTSHRARPSDHNPDYSDGGIVRAIDITNAGIDVDSLIAVAIRDARTRYVISRGRIWTRENGWAKYTGANRHDKHVHISVRSVGNYDRDARSWGLASRMSNTTGGGSAGINVPGGSLPAPLEEAFMAALSDAQQKAMYDRIMGALPGKENGRAAYPRVLDTGDGQHILDSIALARNQIAEFTRAVVNAGVAEIVAALPNVDPAKVEEALTKAATDAFAGFELTLAPKEK